MYKVACLLFFFITCLHELNAQIFPKEGSILNYRIIGFSYPKEINTSNYKLEIAAGDYYSEDSFNRNIFLSRFVDTNKIIAEVPAFGKQYTWRIVSVHNKSKETKERDLHHFSTGIVPQVDTGNNRLRIIQRLNEDRDIYVFLDGNGVLYNMNGNPVWYLPNTEGIMNSNSTIRDLKMSPENTITFIVGDNHVGQKIYDVDYNGNILWRGPNNGIVSGDSIENYHHEFTQLTNGHYMALGSEYIPSRLPAAKDSNVVTLFDHVNKSDDLNGSKMPFGTLIEYDETGKVVWSWKSSKYFRSSDIGYRKRPIALTMMDVHDNGFFFDEKKKIIYLSFRNVSRIIKVKYPEGKVLNAYGEVYKPGFKVTGNELFCGQHSCGRTGDGYMYVFNNNSCNQGGLPKLVKMQEPINQKGILKKIWEYECTIDGVANDKQVQHRFDTNGNIVEMPDHSLFASMSSSGYSKVFIVDQGKKILWSAIPEKWNREEMIWVTIPEFRASTISDKLELERLIWNSEKN